MDLKPLQKNKWLLVLGALGVVLILFGSYWSTWSRNVPAMASPTPSGQTDSSAPSSGSAGQQIDDAVKLENTYDSQLTKILQGIAGVNSVSVMVTLDSTGLLTVANNVRKTTESRTSGSDHSSSTTVDSSVSLQNVNGQQTPFVVQSISPKVRGVLVTVNANDFDVAESEIINAITSVLDVPAYKISVEPQKASLTTN